MKRLCLFFAGFVFLVLFLSMPLFAVYKSGYVAGVCPPFPLRDEAGQIINPVNGINADKPYSPKQTCGASGCHDYTKITEGFHFTQGKGEPIPEEHARRYAWVTSPGNYGGPW